MCTYVCACVFNRCLLRTYYVVALYKMLGIYVTVDKTDRNSL